MERQSDKPSRLSALSHPLFRRLFIALAISDMGFWAQYVVVAVYLFDLTNSPIVVGLATFAQLGPMLVSPLLGGRLADRWNRRLLGIWSAMTLTGAATLLAGAAALESVSLVLTCLLLGGLGNAIGYPAMAALLPTIVPPRHMQSAVGLQNVQLNGARVFGPAVGGVLYSSTNASIVFVFNAVTYVFVLVVLLTPAARKVGARHLDKDGVQRDQGALRLLRTHSSVRYVIPRITAFSLMGLSFAGLMPVVASDLAGIDVTTWRYGLFYGLFATGAALGAFSGGATPGTASDPSVRYAFLIMAIALAIVAIGPGAFGASVAITVIGVMYLYTYTRVLGELHAQIPDEIRGRAMALWVVAYVGMVPLGALMFGPVAETVGIEVVTLVNASAAVLIGVAFPPDWATKAAQGHGSGETQAGIVRSC